MPRNEHTELSSSKPLSFSFLLWPPRTANLVISFCVLLPEQKISELKHQLPPSGPAQEGTLPCSQQVHQEPRSQRKHRDQLWLCHSSLVCGSKHLRAQQPPPPASRAVENSRQSTAPFFATCETTLTLYLLTPHQETSRHHVVLCPRLHCPNPLLINVVIVTQSSCYNW